MLTELFGTADGITWGQECARAAVVFVYGLVVIRLAGRRLFGKWAALDFIVGIIIGSSLSRAITGNAALGGTLAATTLMLVLHWVLARSAARSRWIARIVEGTPIALARDGRADQPALLRHAVSGQDLEEALRRAGIECVGNARLIVLEPSGAITVLKGAVPEVKPPC